MVIAELIGVEKVIGTLNAMPGRAVAAIRVAMERQAIALTGYVQAEKLTGQVLKVQTGKLRRSITYKMEDSGSNITAMVGTNTEYARIHELGGQTRAHFITPKNSKVLAFMMGGNQVFAKWVAHPGSKMPERSFLRSALSDRGPSIREALADAMRKAIEGAA